MNLLVSKLNLKWLIVPHARKFPEIIKPVSLTVTFPTDWPRKAVKTLSCSRVYLDFYFQSIPLDVFSPFTHSFSSSKFISLGPFECKHVKGRAVSCSLLYAPASRTVHSIAHGRLSIYLCWLIDGLFLVTIVGGSERGKRSHAGAVSWEVGTTVSISLPNVMGDTYPVYLLLLAHQARWNHSHTMPHTPLCLPNKSWMPENVPGNHSSPPSLLTFASDFLSFSFCLLVPNSLTWPQALLLSFDPDPWSFLVARVPGFEFKLHSLSSCVALGKFLNPSAPQFPDGEMRIIAVPFRRLLRRLDDQICVKPLDQRVTCNRHKMPVYCYYYYHAVILGLSMSCQRKANRITTGWNTW